MPVTRFCIVTSIKRYSTTYTYHTVLANIHTQPYSALCTYSALYTCSSVVCSYLSMHGLGLLHEVHPKLLLAEIHLVLGLDRLPAGNRPQLHSCAFQWAKMSTQQAQGSRHDDELKKHSRNHSRNQHVPFSSRLYIYICIHVKSRPTDMRHKP